MIHITDPFANLKTQKLGHLNSGPASAIYLHSYVT